MRWHIKSGNIMSIREDIFFFILRLINVNIKEKFFEEKDQESIAEQITIATRKRIVVSHYFA